MCRVGRYEGGKWDRCGIRLELIMARRIDNTRVRSVRNNADSLRPGVSFANLVNYGRLGVDYLGNFGSVNYMVAEENNPMEDTATGVCVTGASLRIIVC